MKLSHLLFISLMLVKTDVYAGWSSGGGELIGDSHNPWFVNNTEAVKYCILIDENNFGLRKEVALGHVKKAFEYWKEEFLVSPSHSDPLLKIAQHEYIYGECSENTDVVFQFGILNEEQKNKIGDTTKYLGLAVRTEYDQVNLKGKGFIYISPEKGPLKFKSEEGSLELPWSFEDGKLLMVTLAHELGHVFGLTHIGSDASTIMSEDLLDQLMNPLIAAMYVKLFSEIMLPHIFKYESKRSFSLETCTFDPYIDAKTIKFFGLNEKTRCIFFRHQNNEIRVSAGIAVSDEPFQLKFEDAGAVTIKERHDFGIHSGVVLRLPMEQKIFPDTNGKIPGPSIYESEFTGTFISKDQLTKREVFFKANPSIMNRVGGVMDGKLVMDLVSSARFKSKKKKRSCSVSN